MTARVYPVLLEHWQRRRLIPLYGPDEVLRTIPWALAERARHQAERNHSQSLERLAERGGLSPAELVVALEGEGLFGERFRELSWTDDGRRAYEALLEHLARFQGEEVQP